MSAVASGAHQFDFVNVNLAAGPLLKWQRSSPDIKAEFPFSPAGDHPTFDPLPVVSAKEDGQTMTCPAVLLRALSPYVMSPTVSGEHQFDFVNVNLAAGRLLKWRGGV